jgi:hypothetical protein
MNNADDVSQAERRRIMAEERRLRTYHGVAASSVDDEKGGRYAGSGSKQTIVGSSPISYPRIPSGPWSKNEMPDEPSLGYSVEDHDPVGELHEQRASTSAAPGVEVGPVGQNTGPAAGSNKFRRRF